MHRCTVNAKLTIAAALDWKFYRMGFHSNMQHYKENGRPTNHSDANNSPWVAIPVLIAHNTNHIRRRLDVFRSGLPVRRKKSRRSSVLTADANKTVLAPGWTKPACINGEFPYDPDMYLITRKFRLKLISGMQSEDMIAPVKQERILATNPAKATPVRPSNRVKKGRGESG